MIKASRGTQDFYGEECEHVVHLESLSRTCFQKFNFKEIRTPIFEDSQLFSKGVGEENEVVKKEMYRFKDKGNRDLTLRPEGTAAVIRSFIENQRYHQIQRLFYMGPFFRYERPQAGRFRQFHQIGAELIGEKSAYADFTIINLAYTLFREFGLKDLYFSINTIGDFSCRNEIIKLIHNFFNPMFDSLSIQCQETLKKNPLRLLDSKDATIQSMLKNFPDIKTVLNQESLNHFKLLCHLLDNTGIPYKVDPLLVRGLDYYTHTTFEIRSNKLGSQSALCGGGRYNNLIETLGGKQTPSVGFAFGVERLLLLTQNLKKRQKTLKIVLIGLGDKAKLKAINLLEELRILPHTFYSIFEHNKLDKCLKQANKENADYCIILGENELKTNIIILKNLTTGKQEKLNMKNLKLEMEEKLQILK